MRGVSAGTSAGQSRPAGNRGSSKEAAAVAPAGYPGCQNRTNSRQRQQSAMADGVELTVQAAAEAGLCSPVNEDATFKLETSRQLAPKHARQHGVREGGQGRAGGDEQPEVKGPGTAEGSSGNGSTAERRRRWRRRRKRAALSLRRCPAACLPPTFSLTISLRRPAAMPPKSLEGSKNPRPSTVRPVSSASCRR